MIDTINPNITAGIGAGESNPLNMIYKFAATQNALNQNALFQQTFRARQAMGPISQKAMQDATGPDGQPDMEKYYTNLAIGVSTHPDTAFIAPDVLNGLANKRLIDAQTLNQKLESKTRQLGIASQVAAGSLPDYDGSPGHDIGAVMSKIYAAGGFDSVDDMKKHIPWMAMMDGKPVAEQRAQLAQLARSMNQGAELSSKINGVFTQNLYRDAQGNSYPGWASSVMGATRPEMGGFGSGAPGGSLPPSQGFPGAGGAASGAPALGGAVTTPAAVPQQQQAPSAPQLTLRQPGPQLEESLKYGKSLDDAADYSQRFLNTTKEGEQLLNRAMTGRAIPTRLEIARWATSAGVDPKKVDEIAGGSANETQALAKIMLFIGTQSMRQANEGNAAVRSVQEWQKFIEANPNLANDPPAIRQMWSLMKQQSRMVVAEQAEYYNRRDSGGDLTTFRKDWNQYSDQKMDDYLRAVKDKDWSQPTAIGE